MFKALERLKKLLGDTLLIRVMTTLKVTLFS